MADPVKSPSFTWAGMVLAVLASALEPAAQLRDGLEGNPAKPVMDLLEDL
jgi:hypothetical protein